MHAKVLVENLSENWTDAQAARASSLSSYEIACAAGLDPYNSALALWSLKTGKVKAPPQSDAMWLASRLQPVIVQMYRRNTGSRTVDPNALFCHPEREFAAARPAALICNSDDYLGSVGIVKVAKVHERSMFAWKDESEEIPMKHLIRVQWELGIFGLELCDFAVLSSADEFAVRQVEFSPEVFERACEIAANFLDCVKQDIPPAAGPGDRKLIDQIVGKRTEPPVDLTGDEEIPNLLDLIAEHGDRRRNLNRQAKELEEVEKAAENQLLMKIGKASSAYCLNLRGDTRILTPKTTVVQEAVRSGYSFTKLYIK